EEPTLYVDLSPSRVAAAAHGVDFGVSWPGWDYYAAIYTGAPDSFEVMRPGNLMTFVLDYYVDGTTRNRVSFLTVGLAEVLDQWQRDHHDAYALALLAGTEDRVHVADLEQ